MVPVYSAAESFRAAVRMSAGVLVPTGFLGSDARVSARESATAGTIRRVVYLRQGVGEIFGASTYLSDDASPALVDEVV